MRSKIRYTKIIYSGVAILAIALLFCAESGYQAEAEEETVKGQKVKPIDLWPDDYADPHKYNPNKDNRTPEGLEFAATSTRAGQLGETYTKLNFSMEKVFGETVPASGDEQCLTCHQGIEEISANHKFACTQCHGGDGSATDQESAHADMVSNPSDLSVAEQSCGECHTDHAARVSGSLMATAAGEINTTRYVWGAQNSPKGMYATTAIGELKTIPTFAESNELVDDLLRKKCLRCHLNNAAPHRQGDYRATGCAACHMVYSNDGATQTKDAAIQEVAAQKPEKLDLSGLGPMAKRGYPLLHKFTTAIPTVQCVRCHSGNRTGTDYIGLAEHDYEKMYRSPRSQGGIPSSLYGIEHHFLKSDIHYEKGMTCIDCHNQSEVEGDGKSYDFGHQAVQVRCQDCHGTPTARPQTKTVAAGDPAIKTAESNPNYSVKEGDMVAVTSGGTLLANVKEQGDKLILTSKVTGKAHEVPLLADSSSQPVNHKVAAHIERMECHSCHARWVAQDYGLHVMREDYAGYGKWKRWRESDPNTMFVLFSNLGSDVGDKVVLPNKHIWGMKPEEASEPVSMDWLTGESSLGIWYSAWTLRNWEDVVLGYNSRGKVSIFRPQYQYFVSHIGPDFMNAKKDVAAIKGKIATAATEEESLALKAELLEAQKKVEAQLFKDGEIPQTQDGKAGLVMNPSVPHTTRKVVRRCEKCHQYGNAAGLGQTQYLRREEKHVPLLDSERMGLPIDFQLNQMAAENGDVLQITTHPGARVFKAEEIEALMGKSKAYRALRYLDLIANNYLTIKDRQNLTGGVERQVIPGNSLGDVREVGSYYDWKRYGFWQTDPAVFKDEYFTSPDPQSLKTDFSNDPAILKEKEEIEQASGTIIDDENANLNWKPEE